MTIGIVAGLLIVIGVLVWVLHPLVAARQARQQPVAGQGDAALENLLFERETTLQAIRDLGFDHDMGKLSDSDFADLDTRYRDHAVEVLRQLDTLGVAPEQALSEDTLDEWIERAVAGLRQGRGEYGTPVQAKVVEEEPVGVGEG